MGLYLTGGEQSMPLNIGQWVDFKYETAFSPVDMAMALTPLIVLHILCCVEAKHFAGGGKEGKRRMIFASNRHTIERSRSRSVPEAVEEMPGGRRR